MPETIGQRIKTARIAAGLSVRGLAEVALGNKKNARLIQNWESEKYVPSLNSLRKIAPHLHLSVAELIVESTPNEAA